MSALSVEVLRGIYTRNEQVRLMKHHEEKYGRMNGGAVDPVALARVRRNLFAADLSPSGLFVEEEMRRMETVEKEKWNFDFANEKPVNDPRGMYKWESFLKKEKHLIAPKVRRVGQGRITDYMTKRKGMKRASDGKIAFLDQQIQTESVQQIQLD